MSRDMARGASGISALRQLESLPVAAQSVISLTAGSARTTYAAHRFRDGWRLAGGGCAASLRAGGLVHSRSRDASNAARTQWLAARDRELRRRVLTATRSDQLITIDGSPEPFLKPIPDPAARLLGPDPETS